MNTPARSARLSGSVRKGNAAYRNGLSAPTARGNKVKYELTVTFLDGTVLRHTFTSLPPDSIFDFVGRPEVRSLTVEQHA